MEFTLGVSPSDLKGARGLSTDVAIPASEKAGQTAYCLWRVMPLDQGLPSNAPEARQVGMILRSQIDRRNGRRVSPGCRACRRGTRPS